MNATHTATNLTLDETAGRLRVNKRTVMRLQKAGHLAKCRVGGRTLVPESSIADYEARRTLNAKQSFSPESASQLLSLLSRPEVLGLLREVIRQELATEAHRKEIAA